ncbi:phage tail tape measure protein [Ochrobactrum sp. MR28]|nr:phage tail tape measure protein [Ochrobactrum sp. MR28]MBX8818949.1 phage tail tape measure protein [Ochrobactrum sp. MR31]
MSVLQSVLKLSVMDGVSSKMRTITGSMNGLMKQSNKIMAPINGTVMRVAGLAAGYVGVREGIRGTVGAAIGFESAFADVRKVVDGSDDQLNNLRRDIIALSKEMPVTAEGFAQIYAAAGQSNIPIQEMSKFSKMVAEVSTAWEVPVAETGQALAEIKNQLRMNVGEIGLYADAINHLGNNTAARAPDLVDYSKRVAATGELYGFAAAETLAFGGAMIASGAQSEVAATSFRNMGRALSIGERATKSHNVAYSKLGLNAVKVAKSMQKDAVKTTLDVIDRIQKLPEWQRISIASALFGDEARALMPLINNSTDLRRQLDMVSDSAKYAGSSFEEYRVRAETTANTIDKVKNNFIALGIGIGDSMLPTINSALNGVLDVFASLEKRTGFFEEFNIGMKGFMQGLGFKDARELVNGLADLMLGPVLDPKGMSDAGERLGRVFMQAKEWGASIRELSAAISESPIAQFFGEMAGYGFKFVLLAAGVGLLAKSILGLGRALLFLSGAKLGFDILKGVAKIGGALIFGAGAKTAAGTAATGAAGAAGAAGALAGGASKVGVFTKLLRGAGMAGTAYSMFEGLKTFDPKGNLWGLTENIDNWSKENLGINPSNLAEPVDKGVPGWKRFLMGRAADPDFNFREHMGIKVGASNASGEKPVSLTAPTIAELNKPSGTQDVRIVNQQPPPNVTNYVNVTANTNASPSEIGQATAEAVGQATKAAIEGAFSDSAVSQ